MRLFGLLVIAFFVVACSDDTGSTSDTTLSVDLATQDQSPGTEAGQLDLNTAPDGPVVDGPVVDGPGTKPDSASVDGGTTCTTDKDCALGKAWCVKGQCVPCDNSGLACKIACTSGWALYTRNGCHPCACAPKNACTTNIDCTLKGQMCYAGAFCWDWCPKNDPTCCYGNICSNSGCKPPPPVGCLVIGCPVGLTCAKTGCASSGCSCSNLGWSCSKDCGGGICQ